MTETLVHDPALRQRYRFTRTPDALLLDNYVEPGGGVTPHVHPTMEERFEVVSGRAEILSGRTWVTADPGDVVVVPPGTRHAFRNAGDEVAHVRCEASPPPPRPVQRLLFSLVGRDQA